MSDESPIQTLSPTRLARRHFITTIAPWSAGAFLTARTIGCAPWTMISGSTAQQTPEPKGMLNEMFDAGMLDLRRRKYGIQSPISSDSMIKFLEKIHKQKYPLSCEISSLSHLLALYGHNIPEDHIIATIPANIDPQYGRHPALTDFSNPKNIPGFTPPDPWGILACPLAQSFNDAFAGKTRLYARYTDNEHNPFQNVAEFTNFLDRNLAGNNFPIIWYINADHLHPPTNFHGNTYYADEHAGLITGIGNSDGSSRYIELVDPVMLTTYYFGLDKIFEGNQRCNSNTLSLYTK